MFQATNKRISSPSRTYVAVCVNPRLDGYYLKKFTLPESNDEIPEGFRPVELICNNTDEALWYFRSVLNYVARVEGCFPVECIADMEDQQTWGGLFDLKYLGWQQQQQQLPPLNLTLGFYPVT